jgi:hypothetical protein
MTSRSNRTTSKHRSSVRIRVPLSATACTEARIPDDKLVISSIVVAFACVSGSSVPVGAVSYPWRAAREALTVLRVDVVMKSRPENWDE